MHLFDRFELEAVNGGGGDDGGGGGGEICGSNSGAAGASQEMGLETELMIGELDEEGLLEGCLEEGVEPEDMSMEGMRAALLTHFRSSGSSPSSSATSGMGMASASVDPNPWEKHTDSASGHAYWHNNLTNQTSWNAPSPPVPDSV